jgi:carboxymethylenebutenolidase
MLKEEFATLVPATGPLSEDSTRRSFVQRAVGTGFAAAVMPVIAQTAVKTDSTGLIAGEVSIPVGDFKMPAYRAAPAGKANAPVVLVVSEIFGVHEYIADVARRFAKAGYFAIAPELFARQGDPNEYGEIARLISELVSKVPDAQVMADLDATVAWARGPSDSLRCLPWRTSQLALVG